MDPMVREWVVVTQVAVTGTDVALPDAARVPVDVPFDATRRT
jgi:hypothetical protein